ncbi:MAG TPA: glycosyltransferase [Planctomycetaceae bacterium]|nr:glycosyltransferase [Planctomycetaceae bacterium]
MNKNSHDDRNPELSLGMFVKYWQAGQVKTRLAKSIGAQPSAELYHEFVRLLSSRLAHVGDRRILSYWPPERLEDFRELAGSQWELEAQVGLDLGERMQSFFRRRLQLGSSRALLIGSDSPSIPIGTFAEAFDALCSHHVVLGPASDGGYYLVGMSAYHGDIFTDIDWSTPAVWDQTQQRIRQLGLRSHVLPRHFDVDQWQDLRLLKMDLEGLTAEEKESDESVQHLTVLLDRVLSLPPGDQHNHDADRNSQNEAQRR